MMPHAAPSRLLAVLPLALPVTLSFTLIVVLAIHPASTTPFTSSSHATRAHAHTQHGRLWRAAEDAGAAAAEAATTSIFRNSNNRHLVKTPFRDSLMSLSLPPMGYMTEADVGCEPNMNQAHVQSTAKVMAEDGWAESGYSYVVLGDCWMGLRNSGGELTSDPDRFPSGIPALAHFLHSLPQPLNIGLSVDRGNRTCVGGEGSGSEGHVEQDAATMSGWNVDLIREGSCSGSMEWQTAQKQFMAMSQAIQSHHEPGVNESSILFSIDTEEDAFATIGAKIANTWTIAPKLKGWPDVLSVLDELQSAGFNSSAQFASGTDFASVGFIDLGLLLSMDDGGIHILTLEQSKFQFGQWAMLAAPLFISASIIRMDEKLTNMYLNSEVLAINQDPLVAPAILAYSSSEKLLSNGAAQIWARRLVDGQSFAVHFINAGPTNIDLACDAACFETLVEFGAGGGSTGGGAIPGSHGWGVRVRDVWNQADLALLTTPTWVAADLPANGGSALYTFTWQPIDPSANPGPLTPGDPHSAIALDPALQPRNHSRIPGYEKYVEQCGEFVWRYFNTSGKHYPTMGQPYYFLLSGLDEKGQPHPAFKRLLNNGTLPPRAGDILVAKGPGSGEFHTALIQAVQGNTVVIFQANVAWDWQAPGKFLYARLPLQYDYTTGLYYMPDLPTSKFGYRHDFWVAGWIHPTGDENSLPGAPQ